MRKAFSEEEHQLIERIRQGDRQSFAALVERYQNQIYAVIFRRVRDAEIAKELTQDVFVRAYKSLRSFRADSSFSTWLTRIALNVVASYYKSRLYRERAQTDHEFPAIVRAVEGDSSSREEALRRQIDRLSPKLRECLLLCSFDNLSYQQAAEVLEVPVGTVCSRMNAAFVCLRRWMKGE